ncbi:disease resistance protein Roq1-like [Rutidosis leptorrhynchoides]|uniref:disease resistance protein Roq1-like n=1 Tax=Rutidosis leptorrhynchoides TaxID=125765 RepID=UPI003A98F1F7
MYAEIDDEEKSKWDGKIDKWKKALTDVANLKGEAVTTSTTGRKQTEVIKNLIGDVNRRLGVLIVMNSPVLTGMDEHIEFISSWLKDGSTDTVDILTISGMGGIGKTCLAEYIYVKHSLSFERSSLIKDINKKCCTDQSVKMIDLQKELFSDISKSKVVKSKAVPDYKSNIESALKDKKVLVVLDDVGNVHQLNNLLGQGGFCPGSKIIVTTEDVSLTKKCELHNVQPRHTVLLLKGLNKNSSMQLLSLHAKKPEGLWGDYREVSEKLLKYCEGHPWALKELGLYLSPHGIDGWEEFTKSLDKEMNEDMEKLLRKSFDSLPSPSDKKLFKHIASFFVRKDRVCVETILKACKINLVTGIKNLTDRCLLRIGPRNEFLMHPLIQAMGREVVRQESPNELWKRSRLWSTEDSCNALERNKVMECLQGFVLDWSESQGSIEVDTDAFSTMDNLVLLQLNNVDITGSFQKLPKELVWLCMNRSPLTSIPEDIPMKNLVVLDMSYSKFINVDFDLYNFESAQHSSFQNLKISKSCSKDNSVLLSLKILNLSFCDQLRSLRGLCKFTSLERLILAGCVSLIEICEKIDKCNQLVIIDLSYCIMLRNLPSTMFELKKLEALSLDGCNLHEFPGNVSNDDLQKLSDEFRVYIASQTSSVSNVEADVKPGAICSANTSLVCDSREDKLESYPMEFSSLSMSEMLSLDGEPVVYLPNCVRSLRRIELLSLEECDMLKPFGHPPHRLRKLKYRRWQLQKLLNRSQCHIALAIYTLAHSLIGIEGIVKIKPIADVEDLLYTLGWYDLDLVHKQIMTWNDFRTKKKSQVQLFYEFGIFSTFYGGDEIPYYINRRKRGSSISFGILSSHMKLKGLNFCYRLKGRSQDSGFNLLTVIVSNETKNRTWIYKHYVHWVKVDEESLIWLSHWMFGKNEMEDGDKVTITIPKEYVSSDVSVRECGVSIIYDWENVKYDHHGPTKSQVIDPLHDYKSWDHIIGGDISAFRLTSGEYLLDNHRFFFWHIDCPAYRSFIANGACYKEKGLYTTRSRKSGIVSDATKELVVEGQRNVNEQLMDVEPLVEESRVDPRGRTWGEAGGATAPGNHEREGIMCSMVVLEYLQI